MDYTIINEIIGSYGFPILACAALFLSNLNERKESRKMIAEMTATHKNEVDNLAQVINNNTEAILSLRRED